MALVTRESMSIAKETKAAAEAAAALRKARQVDEQESVFDAFRHMTKTQSAAAGAVSQSLRLPRGQCMAWHPSCRETASSLSVGR